MSHHESVQRMIEEIPIHEEVVQGFQRSMERRSASLEAPLVYQASYDPHEQDLYSIQIRLHGFRSWYEHAQMRVNELLYRALFNNDFDGDIAKAQVILARMRAEYATAPVDQHPPRPAP